MFDKPRWHYRFDNYKRAYFLLREICERQQQEQLEQIAQEGMIQRFEFCVELAWKVMKDYLEHNGIVFTQVFPTAVIKQAGAAKLIANPEIWLQAIDDRNKMRAMLRLRVAMSARHNNLELRGIETVSG